MAVRKLAPRTLAVLKACTEGRVTGSANVYATGWFNYRMIDEAGRERTVTAAVESLQHQDLVERAPKRRGFEPLTFTVKVTAAGSAHIKNQGGA